MTNWLTTFLAVWGAFLATAAFTWNILRDLQDRRKLEVRCAVVQQLGDPAQEKFLGTSLTNVGRRPVMIIGCAAKIRGQKGLALLGDVGHGLPKLLQEHEFYTVLTRNPAPLLQEDIVELWAEDSTGKHWKLGRKELNKLKAEAHAQNGEV